MKNWRTTTFACIAAAGAGLIGAERTGIIDGSSLPNWVNQLATIASVIGTACLGVFAQDKAAAPAKESEPTVPSPIPNPLPPTEPKP